MICKSCGKEMEDGMNFCEHCGTKVEAQSSLCQMCGAEALPGQEYCFNCLNGLNTKPKTKNGSNGTIIAIICVLSALILACVGVITWLIIKPEPTEMSGMIENYYERVEEEEWEEEEYYSAPYFYTVTASSEYPEHTSKNGTRFTYYAYQVTDDNPETTWSPDKADATPWIEFYAYSQQRVQGIVIENGYSKTPELYYQNLRAKKILIECDNYSMTYTLSDMGCQMPETIYFDEPIITDSVRITVLSTYDSMEIDGLEFGDLSISEVDIF